MPNSTFSWSPQTKRGGKREEGRGRKTSSQISNPGPFISLRDFHSHSMKKDEESSMPATLATITPMLSLSVPPKCLPIWECFPLIPLNTHGTQSMHRALVAQLVKNPPAMQETLVRFLSQEDLLEEGEATHSSILGLPLWPQLVKNPHAMWETWVQSLGWDDPWRREQLPTPVF